MDDLKAKVEDQREHLAGIMVTYPSTHGVYEATSARSVRDGARRRRAGLRRRREPQRPRRVGAARTFGADVSHPNLHKTFCIPHGGGPGVARSRSGHLAPHLPNHPRCGGRPRVRGRAGVGGTFGSARSFRSPGPTSAPMGGAGLKRSTEIAVLNANYIAARLREHYPSSTPGNRDLVAHECILDVRGITKDRA